MHAPTTILLRASTTLLLIALLGAHGAAFAGDDKTSDASRPEEVTHSDFWDWWFPGHYPPAFRYDRRLSGPLACGHNDFLHHLVLLPPMEGFQIVEPGRFSLDLKLEAARASKDGEVEPIRFDASYLESVFRLGYGLSEDFEVRAGFNVGWFHPDDEEDSVRLVQEDQTVFPPDDFDPKPNIGDIDLGLKILSAFDPKNHLGLSTALTLKIPVSKNDFLTTGRGDFAVHFMGTARFGLGSGFHLFVHLNAGVSFFDEENVFPEKVYLSPSALYSASAVLPLDEEQCPLGVPVAFLLQMQGHTNAFRKMDGLDSDPVVLHAGLRLLALGWSLDMSAGYGLNETSAPDTVVTVTLGSDF